MIKLLTSSALALLIGFSAAPALANGVQIQQYGWGNAAGGAQAGWKNKVGIHQNGWLNGAAAHQKGWKNTSAIGQQGVNNSATTY